MKNDITIKNSSMDVYDYCEKNGISLAIIEENEFVAVPASYEQGHFFAQETIDFLKFCSGCERSLSETRLKIQKFGKNNVKMKVE